MKPSDHLAYFAEHPIIKNKNNKKNKMDSIIDLEMKVVEWAHRRDLVKPENANRQMLKVMEEDSGGLSLKEVLLRLDIFTLTVQIILLFRELQIYQPIQ